MIKNNYEFIGKGLFFIKEGILAIGDLHLGYEYMLQQAGILAPQEQIETLKKELKEIILEIKNKKYSLKKIVFIGDLKHSFSYNKREKSYFKEIYSFLQKYLPEKNIILIKGNHDTIDYSYGDKLKDYYLYKGLAFSHGHKEFEEIFDKKINTIVIGHLHPSIILKDKGEVKKEKYKCFLVGRYKRKNIIILPSFLSTIEGTTINKLEKNYEDYFSIIPKEKLENFKAHVIGEDKSYNFGKLKNLI